MGITQPNGKSGTYRVPAARVGEIRMIDGTMFGDIVYRLGSFESLQMEPEQLQTVVKRYKEYAHLFKKV